MKEVESSATSVLNSLFVPLTRKRVKELGLSEEAEAKYVARLSRDVESSGRDMTIASGASFRFTFSFFNRQTHWR
jgi:chromosome transmission fidelity protein 18